MELYFVAIILDRDRAADALSITEGLPLRLTLLGHGTARQEHLNLYGLEKTEKAVVVTVADADKTKKLVRAARLKLFIDIPGNGLMLAVPLKSVSSGRTLAYLTDGGKSATGGVPTMNFDYELIVVILNEGHSDMVMDAARSAGAGGGTVLHAKGTSPEGASRFFGMSIADEKEMLMILTAAVQKKAIMRAIMDQAGIQSPAHTVMFSLPVSSVAGLKSVMAAAGQEEE